MLTNCKSKTFSTNCKEIFLGRKKIKIIIKIMKLTNINLKNIMILNRNKKNF